MSVAQEGITDLRQHGHRMGQMRVNQVYLFVIKIFNIFDQTVSKGIGGNNPIIQHQVRM